MIRTLLASRPTVPFSAAGWPRVTWRMAMIAAVLTVNLILVGVTIAAFFLADVGADWAVFREAGRVVWNGTLFVQTPEYWWRYHPLVAYGFAVIGPLGYLAWTAMHFAPLALLPRRVVLIVLLSFPFWSDIYNGNTVTFVFVAAWLAIVNRRPWPFLILCLLIPRPLMLPVMAWLLWKRPELRVPFVVVSAASIALAFALGYGFEWITSPLATGQEFGSQVDIGPANLIGIAWIPIGLLLAVWFTLKGRLGLASLAASPYWLGYYLLMPLLELRDVQKVGGDAPVADVEEGADHHAVNGDRVGACR